MTRARFGFMSAFWAFAWALACVLASRPARATTLYFPHADERYLYRGQHSGGAAYVPEGAGSDPLPLVVFLHGVNRAGALHVWLGGAGRDLRPVVARLSSGASARPFVLAAPSQTRGAGHGRTLWSDFELDHFVDDVVQAVDARAVIDKQWVVLVGHSGAGCNPHGGLASDQGHRSADLPRALIAIDPCLDRKMGKAFARRPARVPLWVMWQSAIWPRQPASFERELEQARPSERVDRIEELPAFGRNPHDAIVPRALERAVGELFARRNQQARAS